MTHDDDDKQDEQPDDDELSADDLIREAEKLVAPKKPRKLIAAERRQKVFELKMQGKTLQDIARILGINYNTAQADFATVTRSIDTTKWLKTRIEGDVMFLDRLIAAISPRALVGEIEAIEAVLKIMQRQHKILGMEAPKRVDVRVLIQQWAEREGLNPMDVIEVVSGMLEGG